MSEIYVLMCLLSINMFLLSLSEGRFCRNLSLSKGCFCRNLSLSEGCFCGILSLSEGFLENFTIFAV